MSLADTIRTSILNGVPDELIRKDSNAPVIRQIGTAMVNGVITGTPVATFTPSWAVTANYQQREIDGKAIKEDDIKMIFQMASGATNPDPQNDFEVPIDGETYRIEDLKSVRPGAGVIIFIAQLRR